MTQSQKSAKSAKSSAKKRPPAKKTIKKKVAETKTSEKSKNRKPAKKTAKKAQASKKLTKKTTSKKIDGDTKKPRKKAAAKKAATKTTTARKTKSSKAASSSQHSPRETGNTQREKAKASAKSTTANSQSAGDNAEKPLLHDYDAFATYLSSVSLKSQDVVGDFFTRRPDFKIGSPQSSSDPLNISEALQETINGLAADPGTVMQRQFKLWGDFAKLMASTSKRIAGETVKPTIEPAPGDKRFAHPAWQDNPLLDFIKQSYLTYASWLVSTIHELDGMDDHDKRRAEFYSHQLLDAIAPSNIPTLNPEVIETTIESKGENLLRGLNNFLEDLERGDGELSIRQADLDYFKLGENVATTPGKVVFQNELIQLIQYEPTTEKVAKRPLLIFPPWINKFYILDLQPQNSFVKWMVEQGRTVFLVSWVNPGPELSDKTFDDYIEEGLFAALDAVNAATNEKNVDAIGYCIGGTMLSTGLALMAKRNDTRIKSATFFTAQADFTDAGDLSLFVDDAQISAIEQQMDAAGGVLEGRAMASTFNMLRSNDLIWSFVIDNYMKGKDPAKFDLLYWNSDTTRMPKHVHLFYLREFYQHNRLAKCELALDGHQLDLSDVNIPIFMQAGETDHIAPANSIYRTAKLFGGDGVQFMLAGSGHIAGVVNHPSRNKYHHSINRDLPDTIDEWKSDAERHGGSWWDYWMTWLDEVSPGTVKARIPGAGQLKPIEDAPGSYVKVKA